MQERNQLPDANQFSIIMAVILLAYALMPYVQAPGGEIKFSLFVFLINFNLNFATAITFLTGVIAAIGIQWMIKSSPHKIARQSTQNWLIPMITAWALGLPLNTLKVGTEWWVVFAFGGCLLAMVFLAEYIVVDFSDARNSLATMVLTAVSFALYLVLTIALRASGSRLYLVLTILVVVIGLISLRTLYLRLNGTLHYGWPIAIAIIVGQFAIGLHYLHLSPMAYGLLLLGPAYSLTSLAVIIEEGSFHPISLSEPLIMLSLLWGFALILG